MLSRMFVVLGLMVTGFFFAASESWAGQITVKVFNANNTQATNVKVYAKVGASGGTLASTSGGNPIMVSGGVAVLTTINETANSFIRIIVTDLSGGTTLATLPGIKGDCTNSQVIVVVLP